MSSNVANLGYLPFNLGSAQNDNILVYLTSSGSWVPVSATGSPLNLVNTSSSQTLSNKTLSAPTFTGTGTGPLTVNGDVEALSGTFFGTSLNVISGIFTLTQNQIVFGTTNTTTLSAPAPSSSITLTLPSSSSDTLVGQSTSAILTSKTLGSNNSLSSSLACTNTPNIGSSGSGLATVYVATLNNGSNLSVPTSGSNLIGDSTSGQTLTNKTLGSSNTLSSTLLCTNTPNLGSSGNGLGTIYLNALSGNVTNSAVASFSAYITTTVNGVSGNGTVYTIICDTKEWDNNNNYSTSTGTFTAPVAGKYLVHGQIAMTGLVSNNTTMQGMISVGGSNDTVFDVQKPNYDNSNNLFFSFSKVINITSASTSVNLTVSVSGNSSKNVNIVGTSYVGSKGTFFQAVLLPS